MVAFAFQRSPRTQHQVLPPPPRLNRSASVPKLSSLFQSSYSLSQSLPPLLPSSPTSPSTRSPLPPTPHHDLYPLSRDKSSLNCDALDIRFLKILRKSCSWLYFPTSARPNRCLDLGCGTGAWILEAAREWPCCEFVGFDLVHIQPPIHLLSPQLADRVKWVQGNFLNPLPFEDDSFDHVHICHIARGVPEDAWDHIISEVVRVLKHGGAIEIFEEDIIFPVLPRSATATPRRRQRKRTASPRPPTFTIKHLAVDSLPTHDHAILEVLFYRLFQRRFINLRPTALILGVLDVHLRGAASTPLINFPLPSPPPFSRCSTPMPMTTLRDDTDTDDSATITSGRSPVESSTPSISVEDLQDPANGSRAFFSDAGVSSSRILLPEARLAATEGTLGINLLRSWQGVISCREAMWEEYRDAVRRNESLICHLDYEEEEGMELSDRARFDLLLARYKADMEARYSIADALVADLGWRRPRVELSKEEERAGRDVAEARRDALRLERSGIGAVPEASRVCRRARGFVGWKGEAYGVGV